MLKMTTTGDKSESELAWPWTLGGCSSSNFRPSKNDVIIIKNAEPCIIL